MNDWLKPCPHGVYEAHAYMSSDLAEDANPWFRRPMNGPPERWCPGGRPVTLEDLGGEKVWWCGYQKEIPENSSECLRFSYHKSKGCGWRILIPLPQMVEK